MTPEQEQLKRDFQKDEFRFLTGEILGHIEEQFKLERYTLVGVFAIYAWLITRGPASNDIAAFTGLAYWLPPTLVFFSMLRSLSLLTTLETQYEYIKTIENDLLGGSGWQQFVVDYRSQKWWSWTFRLSLIAFWAALFILTLIIAWCFGTTISAEKCTYI